MKQALLFSVVALVFCSCGDVSKSELAAFRATENALEQSNKMINSNTVDFQTRLSGMLNDPQTADRASFWKPCASSITALSSSVIDYINKLREQIIAKSGSGSNKISVFESANKKVINQLFIEQEKGKELYQRLKGFADSIRNINPETGRYMDDLKNVSYDYLGSGSVDDVAFNKIYFTRASAASALSVLAKFENDIRNTENKLVAFCYYECVVIHHGYETFQAILRQSSNCVKAGDEIELTAGIGSFSRYTVPTFWVDGKLIKSNDEGMMLYKFKTPLNAGNYSKPVKIEFTKPDGTRESKEYKISYTVIDPKQIQ